MEPNPTEQKQEKKKPKEIEKEKADDMHKLYKKGVKVAKVSTWVRYDAPELVKVITDFGAEKVRFFIAADPDTKTHKGDYVPIIIMQLEKSGLEAEYLHYIPEGEEDRCPLPEGCDNYDN